ncbi:MAG TPA: prephenate dehydrogenase/arogenate dehydrogenase family protein [Gemmatimonadales bacterium]
MRPDVLGVIGLGAIGGSVAWQASRAGIRRVLGYTPQRADGVAAVRAGAITELAPSIQSIVKRTDLVVLAAPPAATLDLLAHMRDRGTAIDQLMTDVTSVKAPVVAAAARAGLESCFAGSHPMTGTHVRGFAAARPDRFENAVVYVTPAGTDDRPVREVAHFWAKVLDARPVIMDATAHDGLLAWTSHLPQVVASALAGVFAEAGPRGVTFGAGALDTSRLAAGSVEMWRDLLLLNREAVLTALDRYQDRLGGLHRALAEGDAASVTSWLHEAARWRRRHDA